MLARQASTVSRLSRGRLVLGTGLGSDETGDFSRFGEPLGPRAAKFDEALAVVRAIRSGAEVHHRGEHLHVDLDAGEPEPHPIPTWTAMSTDHPRVLARAAAGDGIFPLAGPHPPAPEELARLVTAVRPPGRPFDVAVAGNASPVWDQPPTVDLGALTDPLDLSLTVVDAGPSRR
ncbi:LLM class flavin-dependent oxidoreductase [Amycolatopsis sp. NPDC023774]|uniref:LLM class flavin-dependent oxidoreductase n=1 Tax=Amycolatopsis sp. NPDC023774 TaxID=3155015 RepID=UPI0033D678E7